MKTELLLRNKPNDMMIITMTQFISNLHNPETYMKVEKKDQ